MEPFAGIGMNAFCAETAEEAGRLDAPRRASTLAFQSGRRERFASYEEAEAFLAEHRDDPRMASVIARGLTGDAATVRSGLEAKLASTGADELFVMAVGPTLEDRVRSLELMAG